MLLWRHKQETTEQVGKMSIEYDRQARDRAADERVQKRIDQISEDAAVLDRIQRLMRDHEWGPADPEDIAARMLEDIAALVRSTGRAI